MFSRLSRNVFVADAGPKFTFSTGPYLIILVIIALIILTIITAAIVLNMSRFKNATGTAVERGRQSIRRIVGSVRKHSQTDQTPHTRIIDSPDVQVAPRRLSLKRKRERKRVHSTSTEYTFVPAPCKFHAQTSAETLHAAMSRQGYRLPYSIEKYESQKKQTITPDIIVNGLKTDNIPRRGSRKRVSFTSPSECSDIVNSPDADSLAGDPEDAVFDQDTFQSDDSLHRLSLDKLNQVNSSSSDLETQSNGGVFVFQV